MASAVISGEIRVSNQGNVFSKSFAALVTVSQWYTNQIILNNGVSNHVLSLTTLSNPIFLALTATSIVRVNIGGKDWGSATSSLSAGSAGLQFKDLFALVGSGIAVSGPFNLQFANSSGDSAVITIIAGQ